MARWDTTQLANTVIRDAKVPAGSSYRDSGNAQILEIATEEQEATVVPALIRVQGNHLLAYEDTTLVAGTSRYLLPERSIRPERVVLVNSAGKLIARLPLASGDMVDEVLAGFMPRGDAIGYWALENSYAVVALRDSMLQSGYSLRIFYRRQPSTLASIGGAFGGLASSVVDVGLYQVTVQFTSNANATAFYNTLAAGAGGNVDLQTPRPPFETATVLPDGVVPPGVGTTVRVDIATSSVSTAPVVGDPVFVEGYCAFPQLPVALHAVLAAFTTARVLRESGNKAAAAEALAAAERKLESTLTTITPRGDDAETAVDEVWLERSEVW